MAGKNPGPKLNFAQLGGITGVPPEFIAAMELTESLQPVPNGTPPDALSDTVFFSRLETNRTDELVKHTYYKKPGNITLSGVNLDADGNPVQVVRVLFRTGGTFTLPSATAKTGVQDLGNSWSIAETSISGYYNTSGLFVPNVFAEMTYTVERTDSLPLKYRGIVPVTGTTQIVAGTAAAPTLQAGDLTRSETQVSQFLKKVAQSGRDLSVLPVTLTSPTTNEDRQLVTLTETLQVLADAVPATTALQTVQSENLGSGLRFVSILSVTAYAVEQGQRYDARSGVVLPYTKQKLSASAATALIGTPGVTITPIDEQRSEVMTETSSLNTLDSFIRVLDGTASVYIPYTLTGITSVFSIGGDDGSSVGTGGGNAAGTSGSVSINDTQSAEAGASVVPDIYPTYAPHPDGNNVPIIDCVFFMPYNSTKAQKLTKLAALLTTLYGSATTVSLWPIFKTNTWTFVMQAEKVNVRANADARQSVAFGPNTASEGHSTGGGLSVDYSATIRTMTTRECVADTLNVAPNTTQTKTVTATAQSQVNFAGFSQDSGLYTKSITATGTITPTTIGGATTKVSVPTNGLFVLRFDTEMSEYFQRDRVRARVIDASVFA